MLYTVLDFDMRAEGLNSSLHACAPSVLLTEPFPVLPPVPPLTAFSLMSLGEVWFELWFPCPGLPLATSTCAENKE